jgi:hypothetical protein
MSNRLAVSKALVPPLMGVSRGFPEFIRSCRFSGLVENSADVMDLHVELEKHFVEKLRVLWRKVSRMSIIEISGDREASDAFHYYVPLMAGKPLNITTYLQIVKQEALDQTFKLFNGSDLSVSILEIKQVDQYQDTTYRMIYLTTIAVEMSEKNDKLRHKIAKMQKDFIYSGGLAILKRARYEKFSSIQGFSDPSNMSLIKDVEFKGKFEKVVKKLGLTWKGARQLERFVRDYHEELNGMIHNVELTDLNLKTYKQEFGSDKLSLAADCLIHYHIEQTILGLGQDLNLGKWEYGDSIVCPYI